MLRTLPTKKPFKLHGMFKSQNVIRGIKMNLSLTILYSLIIKQLNIIKNKSILSTMLLT